jgi:FkbM family methyltransferase
MLSNSLAKFSARLPSSLKYRLATIRPLYTALLGLGEPLVTAQTIAGPVNWHIDSLTSQQYLLGTYEPYMQQAFVRFVRDGVTVYDVGAHAGYHSLLCALLVGSSGRVIAFEPNPLNRASIERQLRANPQARITVCPVALSDHCESTWLDTSRGTCQGQVSDHGEFAIEARSIDFLVSHEGVPGPQVIKIDVEGHEEQVLRGAVNTVDQFRPVILCDSNGDDTFSEVCAVLEPHGYSVVDGSPIIGIFAGSEHAG